MVDQAYFGPDQPPPGGTSAVWEQLAGEYSSVPHAPGTHVQARFSHLTIYGASYYSYIYARSGDGSPMLWGGAFHWSIRRGVGG